MQFLLGFFVFSLLAGSSIRCSRLSIKGGYCTNVCAREISLELQILIEVVGSSILERLIKKTLFIVSENSSAGYKNPSTPFPNT